MSVPTEAQLAAWRQVTAVFDLIEREVRPGVSARAAPADRVRLLPCFRRQGEFGSNQATAFTLALGVHVLMALLVVLGTMNWQPFKTEQPEAIMIEATMVDTSRIREQREEARRAQEQER